MTTSTNKAVDSVYDFTGYTGTRYVTTWHDTQVEADARVAELLATGATSARRHGASVLGEFRVVGTYEAAAS